MLLTFGARHIHGCGRLYACSPPGGTQCPPFTVLVLVINTHYYCSENSLSVCASTRCLCNIGYTGPDSCNCTACEAGKYKNVSGSTLCSSCARNSSSPVASIDRSSCVCNAGYENKMGTSCSGQHEELNCTACTRGKYKAAGTGVCASCPENFTPISGSAASACVTGKKRLMAVKDVVKVEV